MEDVQLARLKTIAERGWLRTLDDTLGIAHGERQRRTAQPVPALPVWEPLLADRPHHIIPRPHREVLAADHPWGFKLQQPKHLSTRSELPHHQVRGTTLNPEAQTHSRKKEEK